MVKIFIGNLAAGTPVGELREMFEKFGEVTESAVLTNFGFVHMSDEEAAQAAIAEYHRKEVRGQVINVEFSKSRATPGANSAGVCYNCGEKGHLSRACPTRTVQTKEAKTCYFCKESGHTMNVCPLYNSVEDNAPEEVIDFRRLSNKKAQMRQQKSKNLNAPKKAKNKTTEAKDDSDSDDNDGGDDVPSSADAVHPVDQAAGMMRGGPGFPPRPRMPANRFGQVFPPVDPFGRMLRGVDSYGMPLYATPGPRMMAVPPSYYMMRPGGPGGMGYPPQGAGADPTAPTEQGDDRQDRRSSSMDEKKLDAIQKEKNEENEKRPSKRFLRDSPPPRPKAAAYLLY